MSQVAQIEVAHWYSLQNCQISDLNLKVGDQVVFKISAGVDVGKIAKISEVSDDDTTNSEEEFCSVVRKVTTEDLNIISEQRNQRVTAIEYCKKAIDHFSLPMKVIDVHFSFDGGRLVFPFISDGRVDFRELVKDLTHHFQKSIRLQQIGIRDEAKISGDFGSCGRHLCCKTHLKELGSITSELADIQQVSHRGSDRLTGLCGRLRCCLAFEKEAYLAVAKDLPAIGSIIKTPKGSGTVIGWHTLKQTVDVALNGDSHSIIEVPIGKQKE